MLCTYNWENQSSSTLSLRGLKNMCASHFISLWFLSFECYQHCFSIKLIFRKKYVKQRFFFFCLVLFLVLPFLCLFSLVSGIDITLSPLQPLILFPDFLSILMTCTKAYVSQMPFPHSMYLYLIMVISLTPKDY